MGHILHPSSSNHYVNKTIIKDYIIKMQASATSHEWVYLKLENLAALLEL